MTGQAESTLSKYLRAARQTAPKIAGLSPSAEVDGYWLDDNRFFYVSQVFEPSLGRTIRLPFVAECEQRTVHEVISLTALAGLTEAPSRTPMSLETAAAARFDMPDPQTLGVSVGAMDYLIDWKRRAILQATESDSMQALYSPDGRYGCFVEGYDLCLKERESGRVRGLTTDGSAHYSYGRPSEMNLSAISYRRRPYPVGWWSPDSEWFLTYRVDERALPEFALIQSAPPGGGRFLLHHYKYPTPEDPLPTAVYVAVHAPTGRVVPFPEFPVLATSLPPFLARSAWFGQHQTAWFIRFDRYFRHCELVHIDLSDGTARVVLSEEVAAGYIDLHPVFGRGPNVRTLDDSQEIIWFSERDGWGHLYLYDSSGKLKNQITRGEWLVRDIVQVDETRRNLLFLAGGLRQEVDPARRSLCAVNFDGSGFEVLLDHDGDLYVSPDSPGGVDQDGTFSRGRNASGVSPSGRLAVIEYRSLTRGNVTEVVDLSSRSRIVTLASDAPAAPEIARQNFTAVAADGVTRLHGAMFLPREFDRARRYPLIDFIYPGPQYAHQPQSFHSVTSAQAMTLAELGFIVVMMDTRGTPLRSRAFHQLGYGELLEPQLADHAAVVKELCGRFGFIDPGRVGMIGESAGGAATARALFDYGDIFKVGVAVCGVHDSGLHVSMWSDKYRGPPDAPSWIRQANQTAAGKLTGKLLLISGDMDECVHVSHTLLLADALIRADREFDLLIVPNAGHDVLLRSAYAQRRIWDYLVCSLLKEEPPENLSLSYEPWELETAGLRSQREHQ